MQKILYVEDDLSLIDGLKYTLENSGYFVDNARTASEALARFKQDTYDLLLLDVTLPDGTGFDVCKEVRAISTIPIIFLTASDQEISIVRGLDIGADDYITKPFKLNELLSRIKAILRRSLQFSKAAAVLEANGIRIDTAERRVWKNGKSLDLPLVEYKLLCLFLQNAESQKQTKEFLQSIISDVSHQIKTPLAALKMYHEIIISHKEDSETVQSFSEKSQREIKRMEDVIYTLLKLARLDAGIIQMEKNEENLSVLMQDVMERFETWAEQDHKEIVLSGGSDVTLACDALWMSEAFGNIIKNALEHTRPGGHISVQWARSPLMTQIVISDDGIGIHQEDLYNIFKRFYRSRFSSDVHGVGLGLPLAKSIVEAHGGTISVNSTLGAGTTFTLNFFNLTKE